MTQLIETANKFASDFLETWERFGQYDRDAINRLCRLAAATDAELSSAATRVLFSNLIELLNDSFDPRGARAYDLIMAQVIDFFRREDQGRRIDEVLTSFGLATESSLLARRARLRSGDFALTPASIQKAIFLSRVTIGADVAVTSVLMRKMRALAPQAEQVLIGKQAKLSEVFGGETLIRIRNLDYERGGSVVSRLSSWVTLCDAIAEETRGLAPNDYAIIDPDSRLTQLGLLPVTNSDAGYLHFESRSYGPRSGLSLALLASEWFGELFENPNSSEPQVFPWIAPSQESLDLGKAICGRLRSRQVEKVSVISLGVGGNENKRVSLEFEAMLVELIASGSKVVIDEGGDESETRVVDAHIQTLEASGKVVFRMAEGHPIDGIPESIDVLTWRGGIGSLAGLIASSDLYVGYDSAGQHLAAALSVPLLTVFVNNSTPRFAQRWKPAGPGPIEVLLVTRPQHGTVNTPVLIEQAVTLLRRLQDQEAASITGS